MISEVLDLNSTYEIEDRGHETPCWIWQGKRNFEGYGVVRFNGRRCMAHRVSYETAHNAIPEGFVLDHLCCIKSCINPSHLEPVTTQENTRRAREKNGPYVTGSGMEVDVEALREMRRKRVLTIADLAERAGVSKNTISKAENGGSIYPATIRKIAKALEVEPSELVK